MKDINNKLFVKSMILLSLSLAITGCKLDSDTEVLDEIAPEITVIGGDITINQYEAYEELGVTAIDGVDGEVPVITEGLEQLNTDVPGQYVLTYAADDSAGNLATAERIITVLEDMAPVITLNGNNAVSVEKDGDYMDEGATAEDVIDGNVDVNVEITIVIDGAVTVVDSVDTSVEGVVYTIEYNATDSRGNAAVPVTRTVTVVGSDANAPVITLQGEAEVTVYQGEDFTDEGATAVDDVDGDVSVTIDGTVDTDTVGIYVITYSATDTAGNIASEIRTVNVISRTLVAYDFESDIGSWAGWGATVAHDTTEGHDDSSGSLKVTDRNANFKSPKLHLEDQLTAGESYNVKVWVKLASLDAGDAKITFRITDENPDADDKGRTYTSVTGFEAVTNSEWTLLTGTYDYNPVGTVSELYVYVQGPQDAGNTEEYYIDDFAIEVLPDPILIDDFETGIDNWAARSATLALDTNEVYGGANSLTVTDRDKNFSSAKMDLANILTIGDTYRFSAWVKLYAGATGPISMQVKRTDDDGNGFINLTDNTLAASDEKWTRLSGDYTHTANGSVTDLFISVIGPSVADGAGNYYVDNFAIVKVK